MAPAAQEPPVETLLASADAKRGEDATKPCQACHTFDKGGANKVGPNLWGIVGRMRAVHGGLRLFERHEEPRAAAGRSTISTSSSTNPQAFVEGTKMTFAGIARPQTRADVIAYLNTLSDNPAPLPTKAAAGKQPRGAADDLTWQNVPLRPRDCQAARPRRAAAMARHQNRT